MISQTQPFRRISGLIRNRKGYIRLTPITDSGSVRGRRWLRDGLRSRLEIIQGTLSVTQACPVHIVRKIERRWNQRRSPASVPRAAHNDNHSGGGLCPVCSGYASIGPKYRRNGLLRRHWECRACKHTWVTVLRVSP